MTYSAQAALRFLLDNKGKTARFILITKNLHKLIDPIRSRCICLRNPLPNSKEITEILKKIGKGEGIKTSVRAINTIIEISKKINGFVNLNYIINIFQETYITGKYVKYNIKFIPKIDKIIEWINRRNVFDIQGLREPLYELYVNNVDSKIIMRHIFDYYFNHFKHNKILFLEKITEIDHKMALGNKAPLGLEALVFYIIFLLEEESYTEIEEGLANILNKKQENKIKKIKKIG